MTQFEAATAATFVALAAARVDAAAIEAGLGGRLDATNMIPSRVTVLTSIGLDHTEWLGRDARSRSRPRSWRCCATRPRWCWAASRRRSRRWPSARRPSGAPASSAPRRIPVRSCACCAPGAYQRRNFALAMAAVEAFLGELDPRSRDAGRGERVRAGAARADRRAAADLPRRRPQPRRRRGAGRGAARGRRRPPRRRLPGDPRRQGRRGDGASAGAGAGPRRLHGAPRRALGQAARARSRPAPSWRALCARGRAGGRGGAELRERRCGERASWRREPPEGPCWSAGSHYALAPAREAL